MGKSKSIFSVILFMATFYRLPKYIRSIQDWGFLFNASIETWPASLRSCAAGLVSQCLYFIDFVAYSIQCFWNTYHNWVIWLNLDECMFRNSFYWLAILYFVTDRHWHAETTQQITGRQNPPVGLAGYVRTDVKSNWCFNNHVKYGLAISSDNVLKLALIGLRIPADAEKNLSPNRIIGCFHIDKKRELIYIIARHIVDRNVTVH